ncbi:zinc-ribbon domain-containing protein [Cellulophaga baltica]|uniref:Uncharacterized protein n=1 Tax=Cellulophaga baltica TaxID=76594 RepID=A0A1G7CRB2_9FLAO|nr:zinc-ribbon domain-containing protein [Cellulophaga baltica]AIY13239.1 hypothetical protein M667_08445 [Cellulophaga baltica NN016038]AIY13249.1 hypothetical protein M667_08515 [Cellulophaga baltica NN016038]MBA6313197.1 zinc-ribbon domain-containing protein [Cellulophaga baltica]SDE41045.1 hypothetical protein SAMN04487992_10152 [Cellulophaga baltica]
MIIYGTRSAHLHSVQKTTPICPNCEEKGSLLISVYRKHAHIFWIPIFPLGKSGASHCKNCKQALRSSEMPEHLKHEYQKIKKEVKGPIWQFSGMFIALFVLVFAGFASQNNKKLEQEYLNQPMAGDIYEYRVANKQFSTMKVIEVDTDSVFIALNDFEISKASRIYKIDKPENYPDVVYGFSKQEITAMYSSGKIFDINRE